MEKPNKITPKAVFIPDDQHKQMQLMRANGDILNMQSFVSLAIEEKLNALPYHYVWDDSRECYCKVYKRRGT